MESAQREAIRVNFTQLIKGGSAGVMEIADSLLQDSCISQESWNELHESSATSTSKMRTVMRLVQSNPRPDIFHRFMGALEPAHRALVEKVQSSLQEIISTSALAGAHGYTTPPGPFSLPIPETGSAWPPSSSSLPPGLPCRTPDTESGGQLSISGNNKSSGMKPQCSLDSKLALCDENIEHFPVSINLSSKQMTPSLSRQASADSVSGYDSKPSISLAEFNKILFDRQQSPTENYAAAADQDAKNKSITFSEWKKVVFYRQNTEESNCTDVYGPSSSTENNNLGLEPRLPHTRDGVDVTASMNVIGSSTNLGQIAPWDQARHASGPSYDEVDMYQHMRNSFVEQRDLDRRIPIERAQEHLMPNNTRNFRRPQRGHRDPHKKSIEPGRRANQANVKSRDVVPESRSSTDSLYALLPADGYKIGFRKPLSSRSTGRRVFEIESITPRRLGGVYKGFLKIGDTVTAINGLDTSQIASAKDAMNIIDEAENQICLRIEREGHFRHIQQEVELSMTSESESFGFAYCDGTYRPRYPNDTAFYVTRVVPGSVAVGKLEVGDVILSISGQPLAGKTYEQARSITNDLDTEMKLEIIRTKFTPCTK